MSEKVSDLRTGKLSLAAVALCVVAMIGCSKTQASKETSFSDLANVSGTVTGAKPFNAAKVYFKNTDKQILYMVYTDQGHYQAMHLFPGNYEVHATAKGLDSDVQKIVLTAGQGGSANIELHDASVDTNRPEAVPYDQLYPQGQARKIAERLCIRCHGPNFLPSKQWSADQWNSMIDFMEGNGNPQGAQIQPGDLSKSDRAVLVKWLVANFGPNSKVRVMKVETEMPVDESKISKAEYVEYYLPTDGPGVGINAPEYANAKATPWGKKRVGQDVVFDGQGNVWVTDRGTPNRIAKLDPRTGEYVSDVVMPAPTSGIHDLNIDDQGRIWVPEESGPNVDVFDPKQNKWVAAYVVDPDHVVPHKESQSIVIDSKGNVYMNFIVGSAMSRLDAQTKQAKVYLLPTPNAFPYGVVKDSHDNIWIAEFHGSKIARMDAETQKFTEFQPPTHPALIRRLGVDSNNIVWFGLFSGGKFERLDPTTGKITEYNIPWQNSQPYDEKQAADSSDIWFSDGGQGGALVLFDPQTKGFTVYPAPQRTDMPMIRVAHDGSIWYSPRSAKNAGIGVLYPDMTKVTTLAANLNQ